MYISTVINQPKNNMIEVEVPFNGIESELANMRSLGIEVRGVFQEGNGNTQAVLYGSYPVVRAYLAQLWEVEEGGEEMEELFEK